MDILERAARKAIIDSRTEKRAFFGKAKGVGRKAKALGEDFVDFMSQPGVKESKSFSPMSLLGIVAAGVITNQFVRHLIQALENKGIEAMSPAYYKKMLEANPQLMEKDEKEVARLWATMYRTAPHLSRDPVAAGAFITQNLKAQYLDEYGGPPLDSYKTLSDVEGKIQENRDRDIPDTFKALLAAGSLGSLGG